MNKRFQKILNYLLQNYPNCYVVGGFNRERLLGKLSLDIDLTIENGAWELAKHLSTKFRCAFVPLDHERDIARLVIYKDLSIDIASYVGHSLEEDLRNRDLSMNAIACKLHEGLFDLNCPVADLPFVDPCQGIKDLQHKIVRGISKANFESDPLRLLRTFRFAAVLNFKIEEQTYQWIEDLAYQIVQPSPERILAEMAKIFSTSNSARIVELMKQSGLAQFIFTGIQLELDSLKELESGIKNIQNQPLFDSYLKAPLTQARPRFICLKLLALCYQDLKGNPELVEQLGLKLTLGNKEIQLLKLLSQQFSILSGLFYKETPTKTEFFHLFRLSKEDILGLLVFGKIIYSKDKAFELFFEHVLNIYSDPFNPIAHPPSLVNGRDLMKNLNIPAGPVIGQILLRIQEEQAEGVILTKEQALEFARQFTTDKI